MAAHPPTHESRKYMNQTEDKLGHAPYVSDFTAQVREFNLGLDAFVKARPESFMVHLVHARPRNVFDIVQMLYAWSMCSFSHEEVGHLIRIVETNGNADRIDPHVREKWQTKVQADRLLDLYVEIHQLPRDPVGNLIWPKMPVEVDELTV